MDEKHPPLRRFIIILVSGVGVSSIGDFMYLVAINILVIDTTHSAAAVAGLWAVSRIAALLVGPWAGSVTDRLSKRRLLILIELIRAALIASLPFAPTLAWIYVILFCLGICSTFFGSAFLPYQTRLIPDVARKRVNALTSTVRYSAFVTGPALAGLLMVHGNPDLPLEIDAVSFLLSALSFLLLPRVEEGSGAPKRSGVWRVVVADWREAFAILRANRRFFILFALNAAIGVFALTADTQEVVFARQALHLGQLGYSMLVEFAGVGFVAGSLIVMMLAKRAKLSWLIGGGRLLNVAGYLLFALAHSFWLAAFGLIVLGIFGSAASVGFTTYTQTMILTSHMGRVNSVMTPPLQVMNLLFILLGGAAATAFGVRSLMVCMALLMVASASVMVGVTRDG
ncbi:MFS transporter [Ferroacidibacillus organovorans]|uniref:Major facilitator superfamily (MFS) profile domain-containing protein n=1 Tax=Ferroacidibacillus organovorans TaxID=1765683 RepID=A0A1V4ET80_9BACL|nr:MFS transporter [Ferroacidibacillus organovorans]OPG16060.1 hypothetical protein B2M26_08410 [Ferroacidibacillus organovorans]